MELEAIKASTELTGKWLKVEGMWVDVRIFGFGHATVGDSGQSRPVAIIQEASQCLRYVDLRFVRINQ